MAYLDIRDGGLAGGAMAVATGVANASVLHVTGFSALEWLVIAMAERDRLSSLAHPGRIAAALHRVFGGSGQSRLANPRLEALRRFAVLAWHHGGNVAPSDRHAFREAGFSTDQANALLENVFSRRGRRRVGA